MPDIQRKITISPAALTDTATDLEAVLKRYILAGFKHIDIDIQEQPFASRSSVGFDEAMRVVETSGLPSDVVIGWDLKLATPQMAIQRIIEHIDGQMGTRVYVYSNSDLGFLQKVDTTILRIGIGVLSTQSVLDLDFLGKFPEVQLMTISSEQQGQGLVPELLERVTQVRQMGYTGLVSVDGGVNLQTAPVVRKYEVDRVSVGSYFQRSDNLVQAKLDLDSALNS